VSAGSPAAEEFPEGVVIPVDPGRAELPELVALLERLLSDAALREQIGRGAREHVLRHHGLAASIDALVGFLEAALAAKAETLRSILAAKAPEGSLLEYLHEKVGFGAYDLGLGGLDLGVDSLLAEIGEPPR
jgi:hypothetical protein